MLLGVGVAGTVLAVGVAVLVTRPTAVPEPPVPYPLHLVSVVYSGVVVPAADGDAGGDAGKADGEFAFTVTFRVQPGSPVVVEEIRQPSAALSVVSGTRTPFTLNADSPREVRITMRVRDCDIAPRNVSLPFLKVTLRNARAMQVHSFILGSEYAKDLAEAVSRACPVGART
ncbi:Tat pathway signal sequence domain protein [Streptomyces sp. E11-3]|uniref:Tat pathway signal sequence domain protein n=1 Tax=Streptomyces sp. E11-3 TaxID=3110112 RepID=UPI00397F8772